MTSSPRPWLSVVIPIKDERDNLAPLTEQLLKVLGTLPQRPPVAFEIIYIDDGSTDGSGALLDNLAAHHHEVKVVHFDRNYGQTSAFDAGFRKAIGQRRRQHGIRKSGGYAKKKGCQRRRFKIRASALWQAVAPGQD